MLKEVFVRPASEDAFPSTCFSTLIDYGLRPSTRRTLRFSEASVIETMTHASKPTSPEEGGADGDGKSSPPEGKAAFSTDIEKKNDDHPSIEQRLEELFAPQRTPTRPATLKAPKKRPSSPPHSEENHEVPRDRPSPIRLPSKRPEAERKNPTSSRSRRPTYDSRPPRVVHRQSTRQEPPSSLMTPQIAGNESEVFLADMHDFSSAPHGIIPNLSSAHSELPTTHLLRHIIGTGSSSGNRTRREVLTPTCPLSAGQAEHLQCASDFDCVEGVSCIPYGDTIRPSTCHFLFCSKHRENTFCVNDYQCGLKGACLMTLEGTKKCICFVALLAIYAEHVQIESSQVKIEHVGMAKELVSSLKQCTMLECTYAVESQHISKIETPDTLIEMEGTIMEDSATSTQIKSFEAVMTKKAEAKDRSQDDEPMEESVTHNSAALSITPVEAFKPVFLDVDGAVKDLKASAKELIFKNLQHDIRSSTDELDSKMVDLWQSDQRITKAIEELDASVLGRKLYSVCEHDSFYVQHDWFNIVSEVNSTHIEQLPGQIEIAEAKAAGQIQKQAAIHKLPELEKKMREMSKSVWTSLHGTNVQTIIKEIVEAPQRRHELSVRRTQCIRQQAEYWKAYHQFLMQEKIINDEKDWLEGTAQPVAPGSEVDAVSSEPLRDRASGGARI
ncbi:hypothetical protein QR680_002855 [Steinernema hermaphroditum]|uniref:Uncharacterized protein n=1 Tax=Steinernema hermaphroditum TaxID=289476 RepID=A0AA39H660_9BILA|nr:hypothetical protein QR680_002855 [Steinernema hermaphroditum]